MYRGAIAKLIQTDWTEAGINRLAEVCAELLAADSALDHQGSLKVTGTVEFAGAVKALRWAKATSNAVIVPHTTAVNSSYVDCVKATNREGGVTGDVIRIYLPSPGATAECYMDPVAITSGTVLAYQHDQAGDAIAYSISGSEPLLRVALANQDMTWGTVAAGAGPYSATLQSFDFDTLSYVTTGQTISVYSACRNAAASGDYIWVSREPCSKVNEIWLFVGICGDPNFPGGYAPPTAFDSTAFDVTAFS
jgi:hypothetical protein